MERGSGKEGNERKNEAEVNIGGFQNQKNQKKKTPQRTHTQTAVHYCPPSTLLLPTFPLLFSTFFFLALIFPLLSLFFFFFLPLLSFMMNKALFHLPLFI
jgi:cellulose synthase/poly-beta-1,6-N-acetylglucosamine synthase-like glycosyltransferase